jgi:hypothetical protein
MSRIDLIGQNGNEGEHYMMPPCDKCHTRPCLCKAGPLLTHKEVFDGVLSEKPCDGGSNIKQYGLPKGAVELQDLIEFRNMNFATGNIFKAAYRLGECDHSDRARDLRKIIWFAQRELERIE